MAKQLFRKVALERMASPEQLDQTIRVIKPGGWLALLGVALLLAAVISWSIIGSVPEKVIGNGVLISSGEIDSINSPATGMIKNIFVSQGDTVANGQIVARLQRRDLLDQLQKAMQDLEDLEVEYDTLQKIGGIVPSDTNPGMAEQISGLKRQRDELEKTVWRLQGLYGEGLVTKNQLMSSQSDLSSLNLKIQDLERQQMNLDQRIAEAKKNLEILQINYGNQTRVVSSINGTVSEVSAKEGDYLSIGTSIVKVEPNESSVKQIQALLYYPARDGKKIKRGMNVAISPSTVKQEEYGYIQGIVTNVSMYPVSNQSLMRTFQNEGLVNMFATSGTPIEVKAALIPDPATYSQYKWSSSHGPNQTIDSGIICTGSVTVSDQSPISLVIPILKKKLFGVGEDLPASGRQ